MKIDVEDQKLESMLTELEPPYESKEEAMIGRLLDKYGMPFFYKQPVIIYDQGRNNIWYPTFTLPQYGCAVIDYINDSRKSVLEDRLNIYRYNQIPATVLGPKDLDKPNFRRELYEKLQRHTQLQDIFLYEAKLGKH